MTDLVLYSLYGYSHSLLRYHLAQWQRFADFRSVVVEDATAVTSDFRSVSGSLQVPELRPRGHARVEAICQWLIGYVIPRQQEPLALISHIDLWPEKTVDAEAILCDRLVAGVACPRERPAGTMRLGTAWLLIDATASINWPDRRLEAWPASEIFDYRQQLDGDTLFAEPAFRHLSGLSAWARGENRPAIASVVEEPQCESSCLATQETSAARTLKPGTQSNSGEMPAGKSI